MGIWNERGADTNWTIALRGALDAAGYESTRIVAGDTGWEIVAQLAGSPALSAAVDIVGVHYPGTPPAAAYALGKPLWASEMWSLGSTDDWAGAGVLLSDLIQHARWGLSASIIWCLIFSWYAILPFSTPTNTNAGKGHSVLTAAEPWSGHYELSPTIFAVAHVTQFAKPGWMYLNANSTGMGTLPGGGTYTSLFDPYVAAGAPLSFSVIMQTASGGPSAPQTVTFSLVGLAGVAGGATLPPAVHVWLTTEGAPFVQQADVPIAADGTFSLTVPPAAFMSVTTTTGQGAPAPKNPIPPSAPFPFPYADAFEGYAEQGYARYFSDEGGVWVVTPIPQHLLPPPATGAPGTPAPAAPSGSAYFNVVNVVPIVWETNPNPYTLIGNFNGGPNQSAWTDYTVSASGMIDPSAGGSSWGPQYFADMQPCGSGGGSAAPSQAYIVHSADGTLATPAFLESAAHPGFCLGVNGADPTTPGATAVGLVPCNMTGGGGGGGVVAGQGSGEVAEVAAAGGHGRAPLSPPLGASALRAAAVQWQFDAGAKHIVQLASGQCLDVDAQNTSAGVRAVTWPCKPSGQDVNQVWAVQQQPAPGGTVSLQSLFEGLCVDLEEGAPATAGVFLMLSMRIASYTRNGAPPDGYSLYLTASPNATANGRWSFNFKGTVLAAGDAGMPITPGTWYDMAIRAAGTSLTPLLNGVPLTAAVTDAASAFGMAAFGSGWHHAWFDNFAVANNTAVVPRVEAAGE
jgi:hypothetical protein